VYIDLGCPLEELLTVLVKMAVMIQIVNADLKPALSNFVENVGTNGVPFFRNNLKRRLNLVGIVDIHQRGAEFVTSLRLNIVRHHCAAGITVRPEPDKGDPNCTGS